MCMSSGLAEAWAKMRFQPGRAVKTTADHARLGFVPVSGIVEGCYSQRNIFEIKDPSGEKHYIHSAWLEEMTDQNPTSPHQ